MVAIDVSGVPPPTSRRAAKDSAVGTLRSQIPIGSPRRSLLQPSLLLVQDRQEEFVANLRSMQHAVLV